MRMFKFAVVCFALAVLTAGCDEDETAMGPVKMPKKESTWVRTEKVETTKEEVFSGKKRSPADIPIDENLAKELQQVKSSGNQIRVTDGKTCLARVAVLDKKRTAVQHAGGAWNAFERNPGLKLYSMNGMQLDSHINKVVFALNHLCRTAKGVPLNEMAATISKKIEEKGEEAVKQEFAELREDKTDVKNWIEYAEFAKANETREVSYETIEKLVDWSAPLIGLYEDLSKRTVDDNSAPSFLSDAVTLLHVLKKFLSGDPSMIMALREDTAVPFEDLQKGDI